MIYRGNPNIKVSAIDVTGGIIATRTGTLNAPAFIQVSASAITCTGDVIDLDGIAIPGATINSYEDLEYSWDFGDSESNESFIDPVTGNSVNSAIDQTGPEAAHVYRSAGSYTITLTIRDQKSVV